ncbi:ketosteroid isomerase-like protein [Winogradskyella epiphytica]|uniref:Ketosteroid isomerase-like protein n=1 Tax=Winogradskyella epiphytica TaxID=262005 RepID=A0A2V4XG90_9FLAO|nr:nuclear transport factor 2 family protein [Winogradskyella epiphytica]PYE82075.1 ketosteroid isomerase-like protein [Winogradskyella epiphytica]
MRARWIIVTIMIFGIVITSCKQKEEKKVVEEVAVEEVTVDLIQDEFPEVKQEVLATWDAIVQSLKNGDMDQLIAFHAYGPKFTEFKNGKPRNGSEANEQFERNTFGAVTEVVKFDTNDMKVAVYGDVANLTFHSDFHLKFGEDRVVVNDQISLLFVKTDSGWKIVSEHHSPLKKVES